MCTVCGCGQGEVRIDPERKFAESRFVPRVAGVEAHATLRHDHLHAPLVALGHAHAHEHEHEPEHTHLHVDGSLHSLPQAHGDADPHPGVHAHGAPHGDDAGHDRDDDHHHPAPAGDAGLVPAPRSGLSAPGISESRLVRIEADLLAKNDALARANRAHFAAHRLLALNLVSSPGSGKTTLLVRTLQALKDRLPIAVIEGDQQTSNDAERIRATGVRAVQVNTGKGCHLDASMVARAFDRLHGVHDGVLFVENVGNLVCPAGFDLGEAHKVVLASVTEGEDKPLKYPDIFAAASLMLVSKVDLLPHLEFDLDALVANARRVNPGIAVIRVSARTGEGIDARLNWIDAARTVQGLST
jgi:hydrogenase nickel incorporation protein HypB